VKKQAAYSEIVPRGALPINALNPVKTAAKAANAILNRMIASASMGMLSNQVVVPGG
jgi:hypothetical protein